VLAEIEASFVLHQRIKLVHPALAGSFAFLLSLAQATSVSADTFDVYCVPSVDGISTCSGWSDGGTLTCVSSLGGVASCESTTGRQFTCTQDGSGVTTCQNPSKPSGRVGKGNDCTYIGNGSFTCGSQRKNNPDLLPGPNVVNDPISIPDDDVNLTIPSLIP
jgi:hypothetical protein